MSFVNHFLVEKCKFTPYAELCRILVTYNYFNLIVWGINPVDLGGVPRCAQKSCTREGRNYLKIRITFMFIPMQMVERMCLHI
jgi:hypothetical protein